MGLKVFHFFTVSYFFSENLVKDFIKFEVYVQKLG